MTSAPRSTNAGLPAPEVEDPHTRYAWKIREEYGQGFVARGLQLARKLQKGYVE